MKEHHKLERSPFRMTSRDREFWAFHRANPHIYEELVTLTRQGKESGATKLGMKQMFEVLRWNRSITTRDWSDFKLNNNFTSYYARLIMEQEPELDGMFEVRALRS